MSPLEFDAPPRRALVVSLRYLGDALLVTPVVAAMKRTWPACEIDVMTFAPAATILAGNAAVSRVVTVRERPSRPELLRTLAGLWRQYDLAVVAQPGTRPFLYGRVAGRRCVGFVPATRAKSWWKRPLLSRAVAFHADEPTVLENLRLAEAAGAKAGGTEVIAPTTGLDWPALLARIGRPLAPFTYVVIHPSPRTIPKRWTRDGWRALIAHLVGRRYDVVVSGGPGEEEARYLESLLDGLDAGHLHNVQGRMSLAELADLIRHARLFVGVDTATTHIAAATGTPTVAIFGPTNPVIWGPWGGVRYEKVAPVQRRGSIWLIQNPALACVPCQEEGCDRHPASRSDCLDTLAPARVIDEVEQVLGVERSAGVA